MPYKYVPVAKEDTYKLIDAAQNGDRRARDLIVDQNIGLVKNLAMRYASGYYEPEDLMQVGFVGLVKAIDRFDTGYNVMFSTYAVPMIMGEIKRYIRDDGKIKIGRQMKTEMKNLKKLQQEYYHKHGVSPRVSWLADKMEISREHVLEILEAIESLSSIESLDNEAIPEGMHGGEYVDEEAQNVDLIDLKTAIRDLEGERIRPARVRELWRDGSKAALSVTIHEGKNRQIRRMWRQAGLAVRRLQRVREHTLTLGDLPVGQWRYLTQQELRDLEGSEKS